MPRFDPPLPPELAGLAADLPPALTRFRPVAVRPRANGWSPARQRGFIVRLALCGSPHHAAQAVGKSRESAYRLRARPDGSGFARAWEEALGLGRDSIADFALARALRGEVRPVFYRGRKVGSGPATTTGSPWRCSGAAGAGGNAGVEKLGFIGCAPGDLCDVLPASVSALSPRARSSGPRA